MKKLSKMSVVMLFLALALTMTSMSANAKKKVFKSANISWYGGHHHGRKTASGKRFNMHALTAAHKRLPFGTRVEMYNPKNKRKVIVTINDRGPYYGNRKFDVSRAAAMRLGIMKDGHATIKYRILSKG